MEREEIQKRLKKELDKNRYEHTLGVMYTAGSLAMAYGYDYEKAMIAGLLHDCAKCLPTEKKISLCEKNDILISKVERENPGLLHAKAGMVLAEEAYGVKDPQILHAIKVHTTGAPDHFLGDVDRQHGDLSAHLADGRLLFEPYLALRLLQLLLAFVLSLSLRLLDDPLLGGGGLVQDT